MPSPYVIRAGCALGHHLVRQLLRESRAKAAAPRWCNVATVFATVISQNLSQNRSDVVFQNVDAWRRVGRIILTRASTRLTRAYSY